MGIVTVIIAALAVASAVLALLFLQDRNQARKFETKADSLAEELGELKCELARSGGARSDAMAPLTAESIAEFLNKEKGGDPEIMKESGLVAFELGGERYFIDCSRLPQQFILRKGYGGMEETDVHWNILEQAAIQTMKDLVMVKMHVSPNKGYDFMIVSTTHTIASLREDFDFFMSLIADAERKVLEEYWKIMGIMHPKECLDVQHEAGPANGEDFVMKMAQMSAERKKVQS